MKPMFWVWMAIAFLVSHADSIILALCAGAIIFCLGWMLDRPRTVHVIRESERDYEESE